MAQSSEQKREGVMKIVAAVLVAFLLGRPGWAQSGAVWVADYGAGALKAAVAAGKTRLVYSGGSSLAVANHAAMARYVAQRVAEELTNALVLPIIPDGPEASGVVSRAIAAGGFKNVMIMGDDGPPAGDRTFESVAKKLDLDWQTKGVRVYDIHAHEIRPGQGMTLNSDYLAVSGTIVFAEPYEALVVEMDAVLAFEPFIPGARSPQALMKLPAVSNTITGGAAMAAWSGLSVRGRCRSQTLSCGSMAKLDGSPSPHFAGAFGHARSPSNIGRLGVLAWAAWAANARRETHVASAPAMTTNPARTARQIFVRFTAPSCVSW